MGVVFFHIPKTAGTTINSLLRANHPPEEIFAFDKRSGTHFQSMTEYMGLTHEQKARYTCITGHMTLFFLEHVPEDFRTFLFLRNPLERALSVYGHTMRSHHDPVARQFIDRGTSLEEFVRMGAEWQMNNGQTKALAGVDEVAPYGEDDPAMLAAAKHNLQEKFVFCGLQEHFRESIFMLCKMLGFSSASYVSGNIAPTRKKTEDLTPSELDLLTEYNRMDLELYRFAQERFMNMAAFFQRKHGPEMEAFLQGEPV